MAKTETTELKVDFYEVVGGWIRFKLTAGQESFDSRFSEVWDPLPDFKHWLEALAIGVEQASFRHDPEGNTFKFDLERRTVYMEVLTISEVHEETFIDAMVDRRQVVKAFYLGLLNFAASDKFKSKEWEVEYMKERLCKASGVSEEILIGHLVELDRKQLGELLFHADPVYYISYPEANDKNEEWRMFLQDTIGKDKDSSNELKRVETPKEWNIPEDYDFWTNDRKREFVIDCINQQTNGHYGTKIDDFRSSIIEKYLDDE